jgi:hypothetical protein
MLAAPWEKKLSVCEAKGSLHSPQAANLLEASIVSQYTKKRCFYGKSSSEVDSIPFYKRLQLFLMLCARSIWVNAWLLSHTPNPGVKNHVSACPLHCPA